MKKKGFTLVEVLAIIVILGVIMAVVAPSIFNMTQSSKQKSYETLIKNIENAGNLYVNDNEKLVSNEVYNNRTYEVTLQTLVDEGLLKKKLVNPKTNTNLSLDKKVYIYQLSNSNLDVCYEDNDCSLPSNDQYADNSGANVPSLSSNMIPIKWNGSTWIKADKYNHVGDYQWYTYGTTTATRNWANVAIVSQGKKGYYQDADLGTEVKMDDILAFYVWIPRYIYKISTGWHTATAGTINIQFSSKTDDTIGGTISLVTNGKATDSNNTWTNHPSFTFGDTELTGIWVAKFPATALEGVANGMTADGSCPIIGDNVTTKTVKVVPNAIAWRCVQISNVFDISRSLEKNAVYGWGTSGKGIDTHLMKNVEWGAATYLAKSTYGQGTTEIWINPSNTYTTGCAGASTSSAATTGCTYTYSTAYGQNSSTTGNTYGIYDMAGGCWTFMASYIDNGNSSLSIYGNNLLNADSKYKDVYDYVSANGDTQATNYALTINKKGDAQYETSTSGTTETGWFSDYSRMAYATEVFYLRAGGYGGTTASGSFSFLGFSGKAWSSIGFRPVILVNEGL